MSNEENWMQASSSSNDELDNELEKAFSGLEENAESKFPRTRLVIQSNSLPKLVDEDKEDLNDYKEEPTTDFIEKVGKKRQTKKSDSVPEKTKKKRKMQDSVQNSAEINEMWDSVTNSKDDDKVAVTRHKKDEEIEKMFKIVRKKGKAEKNKLEIGIRVEQVMAELEIAVEDDIILNIEGKPAINKLIKLPLLNEVLSKYNLQTEFLNHGVLNLLKNWLEPLPDGSLPNITIRTSVLKNLNDLCINLNQDCRREQLIKSGLPKVIKFLSKSDEEITSNRRLANDLVNKWGRMIYNKNTRYEEMYSKEENEENQQMLLRKEVKKASKVSETKAIEFNTDANLSEFPGPISTNLGRPRGEVVQRLQIPKPVPMDFKIRPESKIDKRLESLVRWQMDDSYVHEKIMDKLKRRKRQNLQAFKLSVDGRTMPKYR